MINYDDKWAVIDRIDGELFATFATRQLARDYARRAHALQVVRTSEYLEYLDDLEDLIEVEDYEDTHHCGEDCSEELTAEEEEDLEKLIGIVYDLVKTELEKETKTMKKRAQQIARAPQIAKATYIAA